MSDLTETGRGFAFIFEVLRRLSWPFVGLLILLIIFVWRSIGGTQGWVDTLSVFVSTLVYSTPIVLGALGGTFSERSGVVNIALEGMMLNGAFFGALFAALTGQIWLGVLFAPLAGWLLSMLHAVLSIYFRVDQIISGTVINILAFGVTAYLNKLIFTSGLIANRSAGRLPPIIEFKVGNAQFTVGYITVFSIVLVFVAQYVLFNTRWGLRTRAVGENPKAADTAGVNVFLMRYRNVWLSGLLAGLGGAFFSLQEVGYFEENMTVGTGFIALAAMIFGNWTPLGAWGAALLFAFSRAMDSALQIWYNVGWLSYITTGLPYLITIIVLTGLIGRSRPPAAVGVPYTKQ